MNQNSRVTNTNFFVPTPVEVQQMKTFDHTGSLILSSNPFPDEELNKTAYDTTTASSPDITAIESPITFDLRDEPWALPLLATAGANVLAILVFEVFVIIKAIHGTPSRRHLFLGQCLLAGLLLASLTGIPFALKPTSLTCASSRALVGLAPAIIFAVLLVKCVFLISLNSGVYLPAHYQGLLLFFIVLVQGVITVQWLSSQSAEVRTFDGTHGDDLQFLNCVVSYKHYLMSLLYVMALILTVAAFSIKCRGIRENYRESAYIGASLGVVLPLWLAWTLSGFVLTERTQPACIGFGIVLTATVIFLVMFIPKGRQLAAVGRDGLYKEDREERLSSISGARYSPSFFLFQPVKPGKEPLRQNSIYKTNISDKVGFGTSVATPPSKGAKAAAVHSIGLPYQYALPKYARPTPHVWPLYHYYQHYYPGSTSAYVTDGRRTEHNLRTLFGIAVPLIPPP